MIFFQVALSYNVKGIEKYKKRIEELDEKSKIFIKIRKLERVREAQVRKENEKKERNINAKRGREIYRRRLDGMKKSQLP